MSQTNAVGAAEGMFADLVNKDSHGQIKVIPYYNGTLGSNTATVADVQHGSIQMTYSGPDNFVSLYPDIGVLLLPFLFTSANQAVNAVNGPVGQTLAKNLEAKSGLKILAWQEFGLEQMITKNPFATVSQLKGVKIRSQTDPVATGLLTSIGAVPVPLTSTEILTSEETGLVAGNPDPIVLKYLTICNLLWQGNTFVINEKFFNKLPPSLQKVVQDAATTVSAKEIASVSGIEKSALKAMEESGVHVSTLSTAERNKWKTVAVASLYKRFPASLEKQLQATKSG
jgi:tripartite ATP-independent transporter DctP family solute receptor